MFRNADQFQDPTILLVSTEKWTISFLVANCRNVRGLELVSY